RPCSFVFNHLMSIFSFNLFFFFNDTATTEIYTTRHTLSLHDALPIAPTTAFPAAFPAARVYARRSPGRSEEHTSELQSRLVTSYAVFCLKKKKKHWRAMLRAKAGTTTSARTCDVDK